MVAVVSSEWWGENNEAQCEETLYIECENWDIKEENSRLGEYKMRGEEIWAPCERKGCLEKDGVREESIKNLRG